MAKAAGLESRAAELQNPALSLCTVLLSGPSFKKSLELQSLNIVYDFLNNEGHQETVHKRQEKN